MEKQIFLEELKKIILPILEENGVELVEFNFIYGRCSSTLKLLVDKKEGEINLEDCTRLNEKIGAILDEQDIVKERYILEVSSPGLDRPLKTKNDFLRCINRNVKFFLSESISSKLELEGTITRVTEELVYVDIKGQLIEIPLVRIKWAKQIIV